MEARNAGLKNFSVICMHKTLPNALRALLDSGELGINGFLLPGHVSAIIGTKAYGFLAKEYGISGAVTGFEPGDILGSILKLIRQQKTGPVIENQYRRVVKDNGNLAALDGLQHLGEIVIPASNVAADIRPRQPLLGQPDPGCEALPRFLQEEPVDFFGAVCEPFVVVLAHPRAVIPELPGVGREPGHRCVYPGGGTNHAAGKD
jgi:hypothetical protein